MGVSEVLSMQSLVPATWAKNEERTDGVERGSSFSEILKGEQKKCPYSHLAKDGLIEYNGVIFVCDYKTNSICLGDMSNPRNVLNISLPSGGNLKVNVDNFGDLSKAAGMFSPADLNAIMRAIAQYNHCTKKLNELDEEEVETAESLTDKTDEEAEEVHKDESDFDAEEADPIFSTMNLFRINMAIENRLAMERS